MISTMPASAVNLSDKYASAKPSRIDWKNERNVELTYTLPGQSSDRFIVWVTVYYHDTSSGLAYMKDATALRGDFGWSVSPGMQKKIIWEYQEDGFSDMEMVHFDSLLVFWKPSPTRKRIEFAGSFLVNWPVPPYLQEGEFEASFQSPIVINSDYVSAAGIGFL